VDAGWLCDKGRFAYSHLQAPDRVVDPLRKAAPRYDEISWDEALDEAESLIRGAEGRIVTALSGSETVELAYALGKLLRQGIGAHSALLPEPVDHSYDAYMAPLSTIRDANLVVVLGDEPVAERAPIVDLWIREARRNGAEIVRQSEGDSELEGRLREAERAVLIVSGADGAGLAAAGGLDRDGCAAFHLPQTANGRGVADAWAAAADAEAENPEPIGLLIVSGDEAAANPNVRAMAELAEKVIAIGMFRRLVAPWADLILPGTSYLERDGTYVNLEGRLQRIRRAAIPPAPDEVAVVSRLAERFGVELSPHAAQVFEEISGICYGGVPYGEVGEQAVLRERVPTSPPAENKVSDTRHVSEGPGLRLVTYRALFSGPAVERVPELDFQRPPAEVELSRDDARRLGIANGQTVNVRSNGTSLELRALLTRELAPGVARIADEHAAGLEGHVEVSA
jgi:NADH-quinone oxidoreductase subunit G